MMQSSEKAKEFLNDLKIQGGETIPGYGHIKIGQLSLYKELKQMESEFQFEVLVAAIKGKIKEYGYYSNNSPYWVQEFYKNLTSLLLRSKSLILDEHQILWISTTFSNDAKFASSWPYNSLISRIEKLVEQAGMTSTLQKAIETIRFDDDIEYAENTKINNRLDLIGKASDNTLYIEDDVFGKTLLGFLEKHPDWIPIISHFQEANKQSSTAPKKWYDTTQNLLAEIDKKQYANSIIDWLGVIMERIKEIHKSGSWSFSFLKDSNIQIVRGIVWSISLLSNDAVNTNIEDFCLLCFKKIPNYGAISVKLGNACIYALSQLPAEVSVARLSNFKTRIKYPSVQKYIEKTLLQMAKKRGISIDEIEELGIPHFKLDGNWELIEDIGDTKAKIKIEDFSLVTLTWYNASKNTYQKSIPASIKDSQKAAITALKKTVKSIKSSLSMNRDRIEMFYLKDRVWKFEKWKQLYIDHNLVSFIAKKLIWSFEENGESVAALFSEGNWIDASGQRIAEPNKNTLVRLWHPVFNSVEEISAWRDFVIENEVKQPFKQAHREIYLLTDAEINTEIYSNRFAAHILRQHQFAALCQQRFWRYNLQGQWDSHNTPYKEIKSYEMTAEFWVEADWDSEVNNMHIFNYISTDKVQFKRGAEILDMEALPKIVFSEIMREVDLFVSVTSIGNDPTWQNGNNTLDNYWHNYSFKKLSESAKVRKSLLMNLIPKLAIGKQCSFSEKYLIVEGKVRTYKIHLGSGNILMEPDNSYLCIVPDKNKSAIKNLFIPFEGDNMLSIIISKALLLAKDDKITDKTILSQIGR